MASGVVLKDSFYEIDHDGRCLGFLVLKAVYSIKDDSRGSNDALIPLCMDFKIFIVFMVNFLKENSAGNRDGLDVVAVVLICTMAGVSNVVNSTPVCKITAEIVGIIYVAMKVVAVVEHFRCGSSTFFRLIFNRINCSTI